MGCVHSDGYGSEHDEGRPSDSDEDFEDDKFLARTQFRRTGGQTQQQRQRLLLPSTRTFNTPQGTTASVPPRSPVVVNPLTGRPSATTATFPTDLDVRNTRAPRRMSAAKNLLAALRAWLPSVPSDDRHELILAARNAWRDAFARSGAGLGDSIRSRSGTASSTGSATLASSLGFSHEGSVNTLLLSSVAGNAPQQRRAKTTRPVLRQLPKLTVQRMSRCSRLFAAFYPRTKALEADAIRSASTFLADAASALSSCSASATAAAMTPHMLGFSGVQHSMQSYHAPHSVLSFARRLELLHGNRARILTLLVRKCQPPGAFAKKDNNGAASMGSGSTEYTRRRYRGYAVMSRWSTRRVTTLIDTIAGGRASSTPSRRSTTSGVASKASPPPLLPPRTGVYVVVPTAVRQVLDWSSSEDDEERLVRRRRAAHVRRLRHRKQRATGAARHSQQDPARPTSMCSRPRHRTARELSGDEHLHVASWIRNISDVAIAMQRSASFDSSAIASREPTPSGRAHSLAGDTADSASLRIAFDAQFRACLPQLLSSAEDGDEGASSVRDHALSNPSTALVASDAVEKSERAAGIDPQMPPSATTSRPFLPLSRLAWDR